MLDLRQKNIIIMGLGVNQGGLGVAQWFSRHKIPVLITDLKTKAQLKSSVDQLKKHKTISWRLGEHRKSDFEKADIVVKNPGAPNDSPYLKIARENGAEIINEAVLFFELCRSKNVIAITGTRGKSSTAYFTYQLLKAAKKRVHLTGNIAQKSFMQLVDSVRPRDWVVAELSSWQLELFADYPYAPRISVLTNIYRDHLNRYGGFGEYAKAKSLITSFQSFKQIFITTKTNKPAAAIAKRTHAKKVWYPALPKKYRDVAPFDGPANYQNLSAAITAARQAGLSESAVMKALPKLKTLPFRQETVGQKGNVVFINDSAATSPEAVIAALERFKKQSVVLITGGEDKELDYTELGRYLKKHAIPTVALIGSATNKLQKTVGSKFFQLKAKSMPAAVKRAYSLVTDQPTILLLSPGAASFNLFINEFDRGRQFNQSVNALLKQKKK